MQLLWKLMFLATVSRVAVAGRKKCNPDGDPTVSEVPLTTEPISQVRTIVGSCRADVMTCPMGGCRYDSRLPSKCPLDGTWCPDTEDREVNCGILGTFNVSFVTSCTCCDDPGIQINGIVVDSEKRSPISRVLLRINKRTRAKSDSAGRFTATVAADTTRVVIKAVLRRGNYIETTKVIEIPSGFKGPVSTTVVMVGIAEPIEVDSEEDNKVFIGSEQNENAMIGIRAGSFRTRKGNYTGKVMISTNYIDTSNRDVEDVIPGQFITGGRRNTEPLVTDGMFAMVARGEAGQPLIVDEVIVRVRAGMRLWTLSADGIWQPIKEETRKKRQIALTDEFLVSIDSATWVNIDKIPGAPRCYFKARVFDEITDVEIETSATATFKPEAVAYTTLNQRLQFYMPSTNTPATTCYEVRCPDISDPADTLVGLINMNAYETISIGGVPYPFITKLIPRELVDYSAAIIPRLGAVLFQIVPDDEIYINYISDALGPFYTDQSTCEASTIDDASFHFLKPELPSYVPYPDDVELCTARVGFFDEYQFFDALDNIDSTITVSALSTWEEDGTTYYYTDTSDMGCSSIGGDFMYVCLKYRCSSDNATTTVRVDIDVPLVKVNGSDRDLPAFYCTPSDCVTDECKGDTGTVSIDGAFEAPIAIGDGPDFFMSISNDCPDKSATDQFALSFNCYSRNIF